MSDTSCCDPLDVDGIGGGGGSEFNDCDCFIGLVVCCVSECMVAILLI